MSALLLAFVFAYQDEAKFKALEVKPGVVGMVGVVDIKLQRLPTYLILDKDATAKLLKSMEADDPRGIAELANDRQPLLRIVKIYTGDTFKVLGTEVDRISLTRLVEVRMSSGAAKDRVGFLLPPQVCKLGGKVIDPTPTDRLAEVRRLLETIMTTFPNSPEARKARQALAVLNGK